MFSHQLLSFSIGSFLVTPSARATESGEFAPSVSIRRGRGTGTHDKVFRFTRRFPSHAGAIDYAIRQGRAEVAASRA